MFGNCCHWKQVDIVKLKGVDFPNCKRPIVTRNNGHPCILYDHFRSVSLLLNINYEFELIRNANILLLKLDTLTQLSTSFDILSINLLNDCEINGLST